MIMPFLSQSTCVTFQTDLGTAWHGSYVGASVLLAVKESPNGAPHLRIWQEIRSRIEKVLAQTKLVTNGSSARCDLIKS